MITVATSALVLIDLQEGIVSMPVAPRTGREVVANALRLADRFRELGGLVVLVRVAFSPDGKDVLRPTTDNPPPSAQRAPNWGEFLPEVGPKEGDLVITKRQWSAFYGTELDLQLRRRKIESIVLAGISTNFGVESTGRQAYELGYSLVFVEDAMAGPSSEAHLLPFKYVFPRLGRIRSTDETLADLE